MLSAISLASVVRSKVMESSPAALPLLRVFRLVLYFLHWGTFIGLCGLNIGSEHVNYTILCRILLPFLRLYPSHVLLHHLISLLRRLPFFSQYHGVFFLFVELMLSPEIMALCLFHLKCTHTASHLFFCLCFLLVLQLLLIVHTASHLFGCLCFLSVLQLLLIVHTASHLFWVFMLFVSSAASFNCTHSFPPFWVFMLFVSSAASFNCTHSFPPFFLFMLFVSSAASVLSIALVALKFLRFFCH